MVAIIVINGIAQVDVRVLLKRELIRSGLLREDKLR